ncbi:hypothetical protein [Streptomyces sp. NRRL S-4]|uniref:hypothetical protein n=1 Tax=Streptomyces sp. NRRL S-4 TaxID=1519471 RepID=UPI00099CE53B|nr:hypothetical protein [Streptomyces sp. NRRL S-4]
MSTGTEQWPTPDTAYAMAPSMVREIGWTAQAAADKPFGTRLGREFWLRKAALLDRIALAEEAAGRGGDAIGTAELAAARLVDLDDSGVICDPRRYVRQQYALWAHEQ